MKYCVFFCFFCLKLFSQNDIIFPQIGNCNSTINSEICFKREFYQILCNNNELKNIKKGAVNVVFEISNEPKIDILYISGLSDYEHNLIKNAFQEIKINKPAIVLKKQSLLNFTIKLLFPLKNYSFGAVFDNENANSVIAQNVKENNKNILFSETNDKYSNELELINNTFFDNNFNNTKQNIPFTHFKYNEFDEALNKVGQNSHTASKPYTYNEVNQYYDFSKKENNYKLKTNSWIGRIIFNDNFVEISNKDYWFVINPIIDLQIGKDTKSKENTFLNTRALQIKGQLGKKINFSTTVFESQGRFADFYNEYSKSIKPGGGNPAIIPGIGTAKKIKETAFDFPSADALISYNANDFIDLQLGYGRNFLGDGYRSMFLSDAASPYTFVKINTSFWKIKYTNIYGWLKDVRPEALIDGTYTTKYMATNYLSWNVTNKLNLGFFESVIWSNANNRGYDANFVNPIIFYRSVEFSSSPKTGNVLLGLSFKYKFNNYLNIYGQFLMDEFALEDVTEKNDSWRNKFAYQLGLKYYNAFTIENFNLQIEYNKVRPYVYAHSNIATNYGHYNQSLGHNWGSNFDEYIFSLRYNYKRWFANVRFTLANRGFDTDSQNDNFNYGSDIYKDYDNDRPYDEGVIVGQGKLSKQFIIENEINYLINYKTNMNVFVNLFYRNIKEDSQNNLWINFGIRSEIFNWYKNY